MKYTCFKFTAQRGYTELLVYMKKTLNRVQVAFRTFITNTKTGFFYG